MTKHLIALAALVLLCTPLMASANEKSSAKTESTYNADDDSYTVKDKTETTDISGTTMKREATKKVTVDEKGNRATKVEVKTTKDPKGLFNKTTTEVENEAKETDGETTISRKKKVDGEIVEENTETQEK